MRKYLVNVIHYFSQFSYAPTFSEVHTFFPRKITRKKLQNFIKTECGAGKLVRLPKYKYIRVSEHSFFDLNFELEFPRYTLPQYSTSQENKSKSQIKIIIKKSDRRIQTYIAFLKWLSLVRFVGLTGKSAMEGWRENDDVDLFIITKSGFLWTTRFVVVLLAKLLGVHGGTGVCLNLFFDEQDLVIPKVKQNIYIAHELLQMKPIVDKNSTYSTLMGANTWVCKIFPNALPQIAKHKVQNVTTVERSNVQTIYEHVFKTFQLPLIRRNRTGFRITPTQLWLFKRDFERSLQKKINM